MLKVSILIVCLAVLGSVMAQDKEIVQSRAEEIANWAGSKMAEYAGVQGELFVQKVNKVSSSIEDSRVKFDLDVSYGTVGQVGNLKSCQMSVVDIPTENVRLFESAPSCQQH